MDKQNNNNQRKRRFHFQESTSLSLIYSSLNILDLYKPKNIFFKRKKLKWNEKNKKIHVFEPCFAFCQHYGRA